MAVRIATQSSQGVSDMLADALKVHFEGSPADVEIGWDEIAKCCTPDQPCTDAAKYLAVLAGEARINGINRVAAIELPQEHRPAGPGYGTKKTTYSNEATEKQIAFLLKLAAERDFHSLSQNDRNLVKLIQGGGKTDKKSASALIDILLHTAYSSAVSTNGFTKDVRDPKLVAAEAKRQAERAQYVTEAGMYKLGDDIYKVQKAVHGSGQLYAKLLVVDGPGSAHFEYATGAIRKLRAEHKLSLEDAKAFGALYGSCCCCGKTLTDENSIAEGIGPVCASKLAA